MKNTVVISAFPACCKNGIFKDTKYSIVCLYPEFSKYCWVDDSADIDPAFPDNYIKGIKESMGKVDFIFVLSHKLIRDALKENNIKYVLIYPDVSLKKEFLDRMRYKGTTSKFIEMMNNNFETYIKEFEEDEYPYQYKLGNDNDLYINEQLLTYFKYLKSENLNIIKVLKLSDDIDTQIIDNNKTILIKISPIVSNIQMMRNFIETVKSKVDHHKFLIVSKDMDFSVLSKKTAIQMRDKLNEIIDKEPNED